MNAEQKQQAKQLIADWTNVSRTSTPAVWFLNGDCMAGFLQELIDAPEPEPEPVGYTNETELDYVRTYEALPVSGAFWPTSDEDACVALYTAPPANNQSEQHLEMVNPPAPSVPDAALVRDAAPDIWRVMCGDWREETVAIHNSEGWIADGLAYKKAAALVEAHNGSLGLEVDAAIEREKKGGAA